MMLIVAIDHQQTEETPSLDWMEQRMALYALVISISLPVYIFDGRVRVPEAAGGVVEDVFL